MPIRYKLIVNILVFVTFAIFMAARELWLVAPDLFGI